MADTDLLDYAGLKSYDSKIKAFMHNRQMTKSAPAVQFYPASETELEPIVDFIFTETPPASGDKSPSNPSTITGTTSASVTHGASENDVNATSYTIAFGSTYYGGSVNFKTGILSVAWQGEQLNQFTAINDIYSSTIVCAYNTSIGHEGNISNIQNFMACNKFPPFNGSEDVEHCRFTGSPGISRVGTNFYINKSRLDVSSAADPSSPTNIEWLAAANAWLANNSVFVVYRLFAPATIQLTPMQILSFAQTDPYVPQLNVIRSDQQSVRVGWQRIDIDSILARLDAIEAQLA